MESVTTTRAAGRPTIQESRRRTVEFVRLVSAEGLTPDEACERSGVSPKRALRLLGEMETLGIAPWASSPRDAA